MIRDIILIAIVFGCMGAFLLLSGMVDIKSIREFL